MSEGSITLEAARLRLGLSAEADPAACRAAFRGALKAARPDLHGGDETAYREIIAAWAVLKAEAGHAPSPALSAPRPHSDPVVTLTPRVALTGGDAWVHDAGRRLRVRVPAGVRQGDRIRLRPLDGGEVVVLTALIRPADGLSVLGDDVYMAALCPRRLIDDGGRLELATWAGPRSLWITRGQPTLRFRLKGLGLPARDSRPAGHLFVSLAPSDTLASEAENRLAAFTRVWTPDRLAA